jgi:hypothetical protein
MDEITVIPASHEDWAGLVRRAAEPDGHEARVALEVHQRLLAVEARLPWVGTAADVAPQAAPTTTAAGLSPVEPAPQALQGVTVEELAEVLSKSPCFNLGAARYLLDHPRLGPLLRGEGAAVQSPLVLPEEPPALAHVNSGFATHQAFEDGYFAGWYSLRAEVARQQGEQADG